MNIGELCNREVIIADRKESIRQAVELMREHHVGDVVVVDESDGQRKPVGVLTDRDIVIECLARDVDPGSVTIGDAMSFDLATVRESEDLFDAITVMRDRGVRRLPVVSDSGILVGILTVDDVIDLLAEQLSGVGKLVAREREREKRLRS